MPRHNRPDLAERARRAFDVDPPGVFDTVGSEILLVANIYELEQAAGIAEVRYASATFDVSPVATEFGRAILFNPGVSGVAVDDILFTLSTGTTGNLRVVRHDAALANVSGTRFYHSAHSLLTATGANVSTESAATASLTQTIDFMYMAGAQPIRLSYPGLVLLPGFGCGIQVATADVILRGGVQWRERNLLDWEAAIVS